LNRAVLALEDGTVFEGTSIGAPTERSGEVVFNTAMTGYQEIFTDPSYAGQIVILTNPQIGNYGTNVEDNEASKAYIEGLVVREFSAIASNWRSDELAQTYLEKRGIPVVTEIDTRALVRHLRTRGVMRGVLSATDRDLQMLVEKARGIPSMAGLDLASRVSTAEPYEWTHAVDACSPSELVARAPEARYHVVAYDYGIKQNILRRLAQVGCRTTVVPSLTSADDVLALKPDGGEVFVSNAQSNSVSEVRTGTDDVSGASLMGEQPVYGLVSSDNALLYVANLSSQYVTVYSIDDGKRIDSTHVGDGPSAMAFSSAGHLLFVVDARSGDVAVVRTATRSLFTMLPAGRGPNAIAIKAFRVP